MPRNLSRSSSWVNRINRGERTVVRYYNSYDVRSHKDRQRSVMAEPELNCRGERPLGGCAELLPDGCKGTPSLGMVYSPRQSFMPKYDPKEALKSGTLFPLLDLPLGGIS